MIKHDLIEAVIGLGKNLFFGSSMECCLVVCRKNKPVERKAKILFIDGKNEIKLERSDAYLKEEHINRLAEAYNDFKDVDGFAKVLETSEILKKNQGNLSIQLYVKSQGETSNDSVEELLTKSIQNQDALQQGFDTLLNKLNDLGIEAL